MEAREYRYQRRLLICSCCLLLLAVLAVVVLVLVYVVFKIEDPTIDLISANVTGIPPPVNYPTPESYQLNLTIGLSVLIRNPNRASLSHSAIGHTDLFYQDTHVGDADVEPGHVPAKGTELLFLNLKVDPDQLRHDMQKLIADVLSGAADFDAEAKISGKIAILGFIKLNAEVTTKCHVVIGFPEFTVRKSGCRTQTKL